MDKKGYVIVPEVVDPIDLAAVDGIWDHMVMDRDDPATWYKDSQNDGLKKYSLCGRYTRPRCSECARALESIVPLPNFGAQTIYG